MKAIALTIYNYVLKLSKDNNIDLNTSEQIETDIENINLIPFFEYIAFHNIEFYDFKNIQITDVDINNAKDLERFVLSHVYYITQK
jgi:hypothetical protein